MERSYLNARPVSAQIEEYIDLVPPERLPRYHVPAPVLGSDSAVEISHGADLTIRNNRGKSIIDSARERGPDIEQALNTAIGGRTPR